MLKDANKVIQADVSVLIEKLKALRISEGLCGIASVHHHTKATRFKLLHKRALQLMSE
jgi:hypothetical protein